MHFRALAVARLSHSSTANVVGEVWESALGAVAPAVVVTQVVEVVVTQVVEVEATLADRTLTNGGGKNAPVYV